MDTVNKKQPLDTASGMKLGAQLFSVRTRLQTPEDLRATFRRIREIGYENVQFSGASTENAELLKEVSQENALPIVLTHVPFDRLTNDTDAVIREHLTFGCPTIGLGYMPKEYQKSDDGLRVFLEKLREPVKKILDAGLRFAYHNHHFEFQKGECGKIFYDVLLEECVDWQFIPDTYWIEFAGYRAVDYLEKIGAGRAINVHFKDMANDEKRSICACGAGTLNFAEIAAVCRKLQVQNILVEQDNAADLEDPFLPMAQSYAHLKPIV